MTFAKNTAGRRRFLATTAAGFVSLLGRPRSASSFPVALGAPREVAIVRQFLLSWSSDMQTVLSFLAEDCECRLTQWGPERKGRSGIAQAIATYVERPRKVITTIFDCSGAGPVVVAHYENKYIYENGDLIWEGVGTFFLRSNKIKEWRGYTIRVS